VADYDDPGWRHIVRSLAFMWIPIIGLLLIRRRRGSADGITWLRFIYLGIVMAVWLMAFVLLFVVPSDRWFKTDQAMWFPPIVVAAGLLSLGYVQRIRSRALDTGNPTALAASYRSNSFIGLAVSEAAALIAFVASFFMGAWWIFLVGASFATIGFILIGPSRREIARRQEQIAAQGSSLSLGRALMGTTPRG
jgi:hypothetical protein